MNAEVLQCNIALSGLIFASIAYHCDLVLSSRTRFFKYFKKNIIPNLWENDHIDKFICKLLSCFTSERDRKQLR